MTRSHMSLLLLAPVVMTAGCSDHRRDPRGVDRDEVLLQVTANGSSEAKPDEARFSVGVSSIAANGEAATLANNAKMTAVVGKLRAAGIAEKDIQTSQLTVARIDYGPNRNRFEANNVVTVLLRDVAKAGEAVAAATGVGANVLSGPDFRVADPEAASRNAYAAAFRAARARADTYAQAAGLKVARVLAIRDGAQPPAPMPYAMDAVMAESANRAPPVMAGTNTSNVTVNVDFALAKP